MAFLADQWWIENLADLSSRWRDGKGGLWREREGTDENWSVWYVCVCMCECVCVCVDIPIIWLHFLLRMRKHNF